MNGENIGMKVVVYGVKKVGFPHCTPYINLFTRREGIYKLLFLKQQKLENVTDVPVLTIFFIVSKSASTVTHKTTVLI